MSIADCILQSRVTQFIRVPTRLHLSRSLLLLSKQTDGLGIAHFSTYYQAAQLASLIRYHASQEAPLSVGLEALDADPHTIYNLLRLTPLGRSHAFHPLTRHSLRIWDRVKFKAKFISPQTHIVFFPQAGLLSCSYFPNFISS